MRGVSYQTLFYPSPIESFGFTVMCKASKDGCTFAPCHPQKVDNKLTQLWLQNSEHKYNRVELIDFLGVVVTW